MKNTKERTIHFVGALFYVTCGFILAVFCFSYISPHPPLYANTKIVRFAGNGGYVNFLFEPNVDLGRHFTYNTRQIFLYLNCKTKQKEKVIWTKTISNGGTYEVFSRERHQFAFTAPLNELCEFELLGNIYPYVGFMEVVSYAKFTARVNQVFN